jgi:predicted nucleotidyltransferase
MEEIKEKERIIKAIHVLFPGVKIYLFGSRARKKHRPMSDIDLALDGGKRLDHYDLLKARNMLEALNVPQKIDLVDLHAVNDELKKIIKTEGIEWTL